jgi:predicted  nucleic acid-binding Zn-ribbon protein
MTEHEWQRRIEFIVDQQALFVSDLQKLQDEQAKSEARISRLEGAVVAVVNMIGDLAKAQKTTDAKFNAMTERLDQVTERVDSLTVRMDTFITMMVERYFGNQNGDVKREE